MRSPFRFFAHRRSANSLAAWTAVAIAPFGLCGTASAQTAAAPPATPAESRPAPEPFVRVAEEKDGAMVLELATRSYRRTDGTGPTVLLVSAVHVADKSFYAAKQAELDACDLVLFEGVKSTGMGEIAADLDDAAKATATTKRMKFLAQLAVAARERTGAFAKDFAGLAADSGRLKGFVERSMNDGWGRAIVLSVEATPEAAGTSASTGARQHLRLRSLGSDGAEGGEGAAADITVESESVAVDRAASSKKADNIQARLAKVLGVSFQLDEMDSSKANWRNSDMDVEVLSDLLEQSGPDASRILRMLEGSSFEAKIAGLFLSLIGTSKTLSTMVKVVMLDTLAHADESFGLPGMDAMQKVIIGDRNRIVLDDLKRVIEREGDKKTIAIFYGAGHMPAFERSFCEEFGLVPTTSTWTPAMRVDPREAGLTQAQVKQMRGWIGSAVKRTRGQ